MKRPNSGARGYDYKWQKFRRAYIRRNPVCEFCGGRASHVDHKENLRKRPDLKYELSNLRPLCQICHNRRTAHDDTNAVTYGAGPDGFPINPKHPWNK